MPDYPVKLGAREKEWILAALPAGKPGYLKYRKMLDEIYILSEGRFGAGNYILGFPGSVVDLSISSMPVFALAQIEYDFGKIYITVHEEFDRQIEVDIKIPVDQLPEECRELSRFTYSDWNPGSRLFDGSQLKEITIVKDKLVLALSPSHRKIWVHCCEDGVNYFIPVSNFYNEIMRLTGNKDPKWALNPSRIFTEMESFGSRDLIAAFAEYNKQWKKVKLYPAEILQPDKGPGTKFSFFKSRG